MLLGYKRLLRCDMELANFALLGLMAGWLAGIK
jgi:hypothetical protein